MTTDSHTDQTEHEVHPHGGHDDEHNWSDLQYIKLALALAVITALEVALSSLTAQQSWLTSQISSLNKSS